MAHVLWGSIGQGYTDALDAIQRRKESDARLKYQQFQFDQAQQSATADLAGADALTQYLASIAQPAPQPGQQSMPKQPNPLSGPIVPPMQGAPGMPPPGAQGPVPPQMLANRGMPSPGAPGSPAGPSMPPPRAAAPYGPQGPMQVPLGPPPNLRPYTAPGAPPGGPAGMGSLMPGFDKIEPPKIVAPDPAKMPPPAQMAADLKKQGVKPQAILAALKSYQPMYDEAQRVQMKDLELQLRASKEAEQAYLRVLALGQKGEQFYTKEGRLKAQEEARTSIDKEKADAAMLRAQKYKTGTGQFIPPAGDVENMAQAVASGRLNPALLSTKGGYREKVLERALQINPNYSSMDYTRENAFGTSEMRAAGTAAANTAIAATAASGGADILEAQAAKVPRSDFRALNRVLLAAKGQAGIPEVGAFEAALNTFVNEYARAVNPKGTPTISDKDHAREILSAADSPEAFKAKMQVLRAEMQRGRQAPLDVARDLRGGPKPGTVESGYRFKGGDPADQKNWEKVK